MVMPDMNLSTAMNAKITGSGEETLVLSHGYGADRSIWDHILPYLTQHYSVLVFDWNFSGAASDLNLYDPKKYNTLDAYADDLIELIDEMKTISSVVFIGHSVSGMIGCIASTKRPELFNKLILICSSPRFLNSEYYKGGFETCDLEQIFSSIESNFHSWASRFASLAVGPNDPLSVQKFGQCLAQMKPEVALSFAKTVFNIDHRDVLEKVLVPCTIIQSTKDSVVPIDVAYYMQKKIKAISTAEIIDAYGHFPQLTDIKCLLDILARVLSCNVYKNSDDISSCPP